MSRGGRRPGAGRKKVEPAVKKLRGTQRADRDGEAPPPAMPGAMIAPSYLSSDLGQLLFGSIARILEQQGRASPHYTDIVALLAQRLEQVQRYQAVLECEGDTYETRTSTGGYMIRKRPEVQMLSDAMRHAHSLLAELMITPATALRLGEGQKPEDNPFEALMNL
jgi:phage terminase small subunit